MAELQKLRRLKWLSRIEMALLFYDPELSSELLSEHARNIV